MTLHVIENNDIRSLEPVSFENANLKERGDLQRFLRNRIDTHRERAGLSPDFPTVIFINTHIKNARTLEEKDKDVPAEQVRLQRTTRF